MTDKEKIRAEIIRRLASCPEHHNAYDEGQENTYRAILSFIDSMQEKPVSTDILRKASEEYLKVLSETPYNNTPVTNAQTIIKELVSYLDNPSKYNPGYYTETIGENLLDEIHNRWEDDPHNKWPKCPFTDFKNIACHFANWQIHQMMKDAVIMEAHEEYGELWGDIRKCNTEKGKKYKVIIIKEE